MFEKLKQLFTTQTLPVLEIVLTSGFEDYEKHAASMETTYAERAALERGLLADRESFEVEGLCYVCGAARRFLVDFKFTAPDDDGELLPNWRERLVCSRCGLINRWRAAIHVFEQECRPARSDAIYLTEQATPLYKRLRRRLPRLVGSEYLDRAVPFGETNPKGIRNETLMELTFDDGSFSYILSFDVFEHMPDYLQAFRECRRCLRPGGRILFSVPFRRQARHNLVRAQVETDGTVQHLLPAEYHGDPVTASGCLCYYHFGWELLDQLRNLGFDQVRALLYWSREYGYLGGEQVFFVARKAT